MALYVFMGRNEDGELASLISADAIMASISNRERIE
jgi:hypothetical protein